MRRFRRRVCSKIRRRSHHGHPHIRPNSHCNHILIHTFTQPDPGIKTTVNKRRSERLVRASGHIYTIVRPGWFDYNNDDEHRIVMLQGDRRHAGTPEDGVISREQIAQVLVTALSNDAAKNKTFELVAERGEAQQDLTPLFAELRNDNPQKNDGVFDIDNMPLTEEPECVINDLNLYSKNSKI